MPDTHCPLCQVDAAEILWSDAFCRVIWVGDADYPGFCRVILNAHVKEMTDLPPAERQRLMGVVFAVEAALREVARPDKINLASLGNLVPHVHWHVIPRWADDPNFPDSIWSAARREKTTRALPGDLQATLAARLAATAIGPRAGLLPPFTPPHTP
ncbi:MAG: HIT family protein [Pseudomonadota bacterium]|nr:HIT family protein [Pseudomonadota bacterium]